MTNTNTPSNNESKHPNPFHHPPLPPIASSSAPPSSSWGGATIRGVGGGIARSAPIRTLPAATPTTAAAAAAATAAAAVGHREYSRGIDARTHPPAHLTHSISSSPHHGTDLVGHANATTSYGDAPQNSGGGGDGGASMAYPPQSASTHSHTTDPVVMSRQTSDVPIMMARQISDYAAIGIDIGGGSGGGMLNTPENSAYLHPHNNTLPLPHSTQHSHQQPQLSSPPPPFTPPQPLLSTTQAAMHPLDQQQQQQQQQYPSHPSFTQQQQHPGISTTTTTNANILDSSSYYQQPSAPAPSYSSLSPQHHHHQQQQQHTAISQRMKPIPQAVSPTKQQLHPHPNTILSPEEEVDIFLRGGSSNTVTITNPSKLHPSNLPSNQSPLEKCHSLALRRAWEDVVQLTKDVLMGGNSVIGSNAGGRGVIGSGSSSGRSQDGDGSGMGCRHHILYNELLRAASGDSSAKARSISTGDGVPELEAEEDSSRSTLQKETCEFIALRCISLLKLRRYEELRYEVTSLGLMPYLPDRQQSTTTQPASTTTSPSTNKSNITESSPLALKEGSLHLTESTDATPDWIPFGLRLLAAQQFQLPAADTTTIADESSQAVDVLYDLRDRTVRTDYWNTPQSLKLWRGAIDNALCNAFIRIREWRLALHTCQDMLLGLEDGVTSEVEWWCNKTTTKTTVSESVASDEEREKMKEVITTAAHVELLSRQLLILLQAGAIAAAEMIQKDVHQHATKVQSLLQQCLRPSASSSRSSMKALSRMSKEFALIHQVPIRMRVNEGLLQFSRLKYTEAVKSFSDALHQQQQQQMDPGISSITLRSYYPAMWNRLTSPGLGFDAEPSLAVACITNLSLCLLYSGNMHLAVEKMEGLIRDDPCLYLTETVAFNLSTLYELGSDGEECTRKKKVLQRVARRFFLHDIGAESLRLG